MVVVIVVTDGGVVMNASGAGKASSSNSRVMLRDGVVVAEDVVATGVGMGALEGVPGALDGSLSFAAIACCSCSNLGPLR